MKTWSVAWRAAILAAMVLAGPGWGCLYGDGTNEQGDDDDDFNPDDDSGDDTGANNAPVLDPVGGVHGVAGQEIVVQLTASDPDGDALTFTAEGLPDGATFDEATGLFAWTPAYRAVGVFPVVFGVTDGELSDTEEVALDVAADTDFKELRVVPERLSLLPGGSFDLRVDGVRDDDTVVPDVWAEWTETEGLCAIDEDFRITCDARGETTVEASLGAKAPVTDAIPAYVGLDLWVAGGISSGLSLVDTATEDVLLDGGMPLGPVPNGLEIRGNEAFVIGSGDATLRVFDARTLALARSFDLSEVVTDPWDLAFLSDEKAYVSGLVTDNVIAIDPRTGEVLANVALPPVAEVGATPAGIEIAGGKVFVACNHVADDFSAYGDGLVYVIDAATDELIDVDGNAENGVTPIVTTQKNVTDLAAGASGDLYAVCTGDWSFAPGSFSRVDVIDPGTYAVTGSIDLGDFTKANSASAAPNGKIYLGDALGPSLFSVDGNAGALLRGAADPIVVPHGDGYSSSSKLRFRDGVAWGVEFNSDTLFAFALDADEDAGAVTFATSLDLTPGEDWIGAQFLAFVPPDPENVR